jgi:hypothetical protein
MRRFQPSRAWGLTAILAISTALACQHFGRTSANPDNLRPDDEKNPEINLLHKYGWTIEGEPKEGTLELSNPVDKTLAARLYLQASKRIGLDFSDRAGRTLPVRHYKVTNDAERGHDLRAHILLADKKIVGAWLTVEGEEIAPGIYALDVNPHKQN